MIPFLISIGFLTAGTWLAYWASEPQREEDRSLFGMVSVFLWIVGALILLGWILHYDAVL
jgi:hypothetical protein